MSENEFEVKPVAVYGSANPMIDLPGYYDERVLLGYVPFIIGTTWWKGRSMLMSALDGIDGSWADIPPEQLFPTAEDAMTAWEQAQPITIPQILLVRCRISDSIAEIIETNFLYRKQGDLF